MSWWYGYLQWTHIAFCQTMYWLTTDFVKVNYLLWKIGSSLCRKPVSIHTLTKSFQLKVLWCQNDMYHQDCYRWFGMNHHDLQQFYTSWRIQDIQNSTTQPFWCGSKFNHHLIQLIKGTPYTYMTHHTFIGVSRYLSWMFDLSFPPISLILSTPTELGYNFWFWLLPSRCSNQNFLELLQ